MERTQPLSIKGTWPDGHTATATQYRAGAPDGEWVDDRYGQTFDFALEFIGPDVDEDAVTSHATDSFWDGVHRVVFVVACRQDADEE